MGSETVEDVDAQTVSDETVRKLFSGVLVAIVGVIVVGLFAGAAIWALQGDTEPPAQMNAVDVGFLQDMLDHHNQALLISNIYLESQPDGQARSYANEVIMFQTRDMGWMRDWLADEGYEPGAPGRESMVWMGMSVPVSEMPGMQSLERLEELAAAEGSTADRLWFEMMSDHHLGGAHMGDHAAANGSRVEVVEFAKSVARNQRVEIVEYEGAMRRLGLD